MSESDDRVKKGWISLTQCSRAGQKIEHHLTYKIVENWCVVSTPLPIKLLPPASPGIKPKGRVRRTDTPALPNRASCKANKCSDAGTGDLGAKTSHKTIR